MSETTDTPNQATEARCKLCGEPMPPGEQMFKFHGYSGPCPKPPLPNLIRTAEGAATEAEWLIEETMSKLDPDNDRDGWFMVRLTKIGEALDDRQKS